MGSVRLYILVFMTAASSWSEAGTLASCNSGAQTAENQCRAAETALKASDAARSASTAASSGNAINQNCSNLGRDIGQQQGDIGKAQGQCQSALSRCSSSCTPNPMNPAENPAIESRKNKCIQTISKELADLGQAMGNLAGDGAQSAACKQASDSKPPQMPQMQPPQSNPDDKKGMTCDSAEGVRYSDCNAAFISKCGKDMNASYCTEFADRYCGSATTGGQSNVSSSGFAGQVAGVVVDKGGEGLGSPFCKMVTAYRFCQAANRGDCPTCRGLYSYSSSECQSNPSQCVPSMNSTQIETAKNNCPLDPIFADPAAVKKLEEGAKKSEPVAENTGVGQATPERVGASGASMSGGNGRGLSTTGGGAQGGVAGALHGATPESLPGGTAVGMETGSSGGGGSSSFTPGEDESESGEKGSTFGSKKPLMPAEAVAGMARDVSNQNGPNIFSISTAVYRNMCSQGRLIHCKGK